MDVEGPGDLADRFAVADEVAGGLLLVLTHFTGPSERDATRDGSASAIIGAAEDECALELGDAGEHGQDHAPRRAGGIGPWLIKRLESGLLFSDPFGDAKQLAGRAGETIEPGDHQDIVLAQLVEQLLEFGAQASGA